MFSGHEDPVLLRCPVLTSNEIQELMDILLQPGNEPMVVSPNSGSHEWSSLRVTSVNSSSMDEEEQKRKRKRSNKESARRSRWRKKRHLEDLKALSDRLTNENRELKNRLGLVVNRCSLVRRQNEQLRSEFVALWTRLENLIRIFEAMQ